MKLKRLQHIITKNIQIAPLTQKLCLHNDGVWQIRRSCKWVELALKRFVTTGATTSSLKIVLSVVECVMCINTYVGHIFFSQENVNYI